MRKRQGLITAQQWYILANGYFEANGETDPPILGTWEKNKDLDLTGPELAAKSNNVWVCLGQCFRKLRLRP